MGGNWTQPPSGTLFPGNYPSNGDRRMNASIDDEVDVHLHSSLPFFNRALIELLFELHRHPLTVDAAAALEDDDDR